MEDYEGAFMQRVVDVDALDTAGRRTATMHFGGIAIECFLKYLIFTSLPKHAKWEWKTETHDPGHTFHNPGHDYEIALRCYNRLRDRVQQFPEVRRWLNEVENPSCHFINMRYLGNEPDDEKYKRWLKAYRSLKRWLQKQATQM